uniref:Uncharacterized protein n=1 Tax=Timema bartmani TaxID=61472 RepID=A0A7R9ETY8_9NEOP|nr:unnamed protein product [Timema bartmani]
MKCTHICVERKSGKRFMEITFNTPNQDLNPNLPLISGLIYCESDAFNHTATETDILQVLIKLNVHGVCPLYCRFSVKNGDPSLQNSCGDDCLKNILCNIVTAQSGDTTQCDLFKTEFDTASASKK